jgi:hypothetical protein
VLLVVIQVLADFLEDDAAVVFVSVECSGGVLQSERKDVFTLLWVGRRGFVCFLGNRLDGILLALNVRYVWVYEVRTHGIQRLLDGSGDARC